MAEKRREALSKYFFDVSKIILALGVFTPLFAPNIFKLAEVLFALIGGVLLGIIGYIFQPKE